MTRNRILADKHRIALAGWPVHGGNNENDSRIATLYGLIKHLKQSGYDGMELECATFALFQKLYFKHSYLTKEKMADILRNKFEEHGLRIFGVLLHSKNEDWE